MDIFKFHSPTSPMKLEQGEIINELKTKMWVERYRSEGEFKFVADVDTGMKEKLPIGSIISHVDTTEVMIVENHEIIDSKNKISEISITGRTFETFFENRIVGSNRTFPNPDVSVDYQLAAGTTWNQTVTMIKDHILQDNLLDDDNALPFVTVLSEITEAGTGFARTVKRGNLHQRLIDHLSIDDIGIRAIRPGPWSPLGASDPNLVISIHAGVDRTNEIIFSHGTGEIESADYLWSNKKLKNAALIVGRWVETWVDTSATGYDRRVMMIDASDIDGMFTEFPTGADYTNVLNAMAQRGFDILSSQISTALANAEVSQDSVKAVYRTDYNVGDFVTVHGDYNEVSIMRVTEYVEIEDENGRSGYPTLTMI